jgi:hypothetical protein
MCATVPTSLTSNVSVFEAPRKAQSPLESYLTLHDCMMGGDVTVTSEPGKGSVFTVRLPGGAATP